MHLPAFGHSHAPEFPEGLTWMNSAPLSLAALRGKPVLVDFWTYSCVNCIRTIPHLVALHEAYKKAGLTVIGVHSPEFVFEKDEQNVSRAIRDLGIPYPVVLDPNFDVWQRYANKYWPHVFFIDRNGTIVFDHAGEGAEDDIESAIILALHDAGVKTLPNRLFTVGTTTHGACYPATHETYLGYLRGHIGNAHDALPETEEAFTDSSEHEKDVPYLHGHWRICSEYIEHTRSLPLANEYLALTYHAFSVNAVLGALDDREVVIDVAIDGSPVPASMAGKDLVIDTDGNTHVHVSRHRMYELISADHYHDASLKLSVRHAGVTMYAFTFGGCTIST